MRIHKPWIAFAIALSILQMPLMALADDDDLSGLDFEEEVNEELGDVKEHAGSGLVVGAHGGYRTGGSSQAGGTMGLRSYKLRMAPRTILFEDALGSVDLGSMDDKLAGGAKGRLRLGYGVATGNSGIGVFGMVNGELAGEVHNRSVQGNSISATVGGEVGFKLNTEDALTLTLAPTLSGRIGKTIDENVLAATVGVRGRVGYEDFLLTTELNHSIAGTGGSRFTEGKLAADVQLGQMLLGVDASVMSVTKTLQDAGSGEKTESTTVVPTVGAHIGYAW